VTPGTGMYYGQLKAWLQRVLWEMSAQHYQSQQQMMVVDPSASSSSAAYNPSFPRFPPFARANLINDLSQDWPSYHPPPYTSGEYEFVAGYEYIEETDTEEADTEVEEDLRHIETASDRNRSSLDLTQIRPVSPQPPVVEGPSRINALAEEEPHSSSSEDTGFLESPVIDRPNNSPKRVNNSTKQTRRSGRARRHRKKVPKKVKSEKMEKIEEPPEDESTPTRPVTPQNIDAVIIATPRARSPSSFPSWHSTPSPPWEPVVRRQRYTKEERMGYRREKAATSGHPITAPCSASQSKEKNNLPPQLTQPEMNTISSVIHPTQPEEDNTISPPPTQPEEMDISSVIQPTQPEKDSNIPSQVSQPETMNISSVIQPIQPEDNTTPPQVSQPETMDTILPQATQPEEDNTIPSQTSQPEKMNDIPSEVTHTDEMNTISSQATRPEEANNIPSQVTHTDEINTISSAIQSTQPEDDNIIPPQVSQPEMDNTILSQATQLEEDNTILSQISQPEMINAIPSQAAQPEEDNTIPSQATQTDDMTTVSSPTKTEEINTIPSPARQPTTCPMIVDTEQWRRRLRERQPEMDRKKAFEEGVRYAQEMREDEDRRVAAEEDQRRMAEARQYAQQARAAYTQQAQAYPQQGQAYFQRARRYPQQGGHTQTGYFYPNTMPMPTAFSFPGYQPQRPNTLAVPGYQPPGFNTLAVPVYQPQTPNTLAAPGYKPQGSDIFARPPYVQHTPQGMYPQIWEAMNTPGWSFDEACMNQQKPNQCLFDPSCCQHRHPYALQTGHPLPVHESCCCYHDRVRCCTCLTPEQQNAPAPPGMHHTEIPEARWGHDYNPAAGAAPAAFAGPAGHRGNARHSRHAAYRRPGPVGPEGVLIDDGVGGFLQPIPGSVRPASGQRGPDGGRDSQSSTSSGSYGHNREGYGPGPSVSNTPTRPVLQGTVESSGEQPREGPNLSLGPSDRSERPTTPGLTLVPATGPTTPPGSPKKSCPQSVDPKDGSARRSVGLGEDSRGPPSEGTLTEKAGDDRPEPPTGTKDEADIVCTLHQGPGDIDVFLILKRVGDLSGESVTKQAHRAVITRNSPSLAEALRAKSASDDNITRLYIQTGARFNAGSTFGLALQALYGRELLSQRNLRSEVVKGLGLDPEKEDSTFPFSMRLAQIDFAFCYASVGAFFGRPDIVRCGIQLALDLLDWESVDFLLACVMRVDEYMLTLPKMNVPAPEVGTIEAAMLGGPYQVDFRLVQTELIMKAVFKYMVENIQPEFKLYERAQATFIKTRIPPPIWTLPGSMSFNMKLESIRYGNKPSYADLKPKRVDINVMSAMLITLPFHMFMPLMDELKKTTMMNADLMKEIVQRREERRLHALYIHHHRNIRPGIIKQAYFDELAYREFVTLDPTQDPSKVTSWKISRVWVGFDFPNKAGRTSRPMTTADLQAASGPSSNVEASNAPGPSARTGTGRKNKPKNKKKNKKN